MGTSEKTALITGANSGIGLATTKCLLSAGYTVIAHVRLDKTNLEGIKSPRLNIVEADLELETGRRVLVDTAQSSGIDILVNNAAEYVYRRKFFDLEISELERLLGVNVIAPIELCQAVLPVMVEKLWGRIINISSISTVTGGNAATLDYTLSKSALDAVTKSLSNEYAKYNVLINSLRVGVINTKFHDLI